MKDKPSFLQDPRLKKPLKFLDKYKFMLLVMLVGAILLLLPTGNSAAKQKADSTEPVGLSFSLKEQEAKIEAALARIDGAGKVRLVLTLRTGMENQYVQDSKKTSQSDGQGGNETSVEQSTVILSRGSGMQEAVLSGQNYPLYQGALVVCGGGGDPSVRLAVTEAISSLTGLGADKITVVKMTSDEVR